MGDTRVPLSISCSSQWDTAFWKHEISLYFKGPGITNFKQRAEKSLSILPRGSTCSPSEGFNRHYFIFVQGDLSDYCVK